MIALYSAALDVEPARLESLARLLSPDEAERARRFHFERDRRRFIVARGTLRLLLGGYLEQDPATLEFSYSDAGKPFLRGPHSSLFFNLSHAGEVAVYAVSRSGPVGIDIEPIGREFPGDMVIEDFFAAGEANALRNCLAPDRPALFYRYWTRKEAYVKATGHGLVQDLKGIDTAAMVPVANDWFHITVNGRPDTAILLRDLDPSPDHRACLAIMSDTPPTAMWMNPPVG